MSVRGRTGGFFARYDNRCGRDIDGHFVLLGVSGQCMTCSVIRTPIDV